MKWGKQNKHHNTIIQERTFPLPNEAKLIFHTEIVNQHLLKIDSDILYTAIVLFIRKLITVYHEAPSNIRWESDHNQNVCHVNINANLIIIINATTTTTTIPII